MKKLFYFLSSMALSLVATTSVQAQKIGEIDVKTSYTKDDLQATIVSLRDWFAGIIGIVAVIMMLYAAFLYIAGGEEKRETAKGYLTYGIIGVVVAILSYAVVSFVNSLL